MTRTWRPSILYLVYYLLFKKVNKYDCCLRNIYISDKIWLRNIQNFRPPDIKNAKDLRDSIFVAAHPLSRLHDNL